MDFSQLKNRIDAVVVGASAGGIEALLSILPVLSAEFPLPIVIVQHLPRERPSLLGEIFSARCRLPAREALDKEPILPGCVYFAPPDYHLLVEDGRVFSLSVDDPVNFSRPSVDVLFDTAADVYGRRLLGVLLTGASRDGASGIDAIRRGGGVTVVQDPSTAQASFMPAAAIAGGQPDHVLPLAQIGELLQSLDKEGPV